MVETNYELGVFKDALLDDNISVQVDAIKRLPSLAAAMEPERTREELIPCIANSVDALSEETCFNLAEQLERLVPFVGGSDHVGILLDILAKLAGEDEVIVRDRAIEALKNIYEGLSKEQCEKSFFPLVENLIKNDWFTTKCSAGCLIAICYPKMSPEKQTELRIYFRNLVQDDSPMVRRSSAMSLIDFLPLLDPEVIRSEFIPIFDNLAQDDQDSVRTLAVDVGVAISKELKDYEIYDYLLNSFNKLSEDTSWRVRLRVSLKLHEIRATEKTRDEIINIYTKCVRDEEAEVRVYAAKNLFNFCFNLLEGYKQNDAYEDIFEKNFEEALVPEVYYMLRDPSEDVRVALSTNVLSLSTILRNDCFNNNILPLVIDALENEEFMPFKENMLKNLNSLPMNVDITKSLKSIRTVIQNLLENSQMHWRTRRNLLMAFLHIAKNSTSEYFDKNLKFFYQYLLNDPIYAIRRTSPIILPLLVKRFGSEWAKDSLIPIFTGFITDSRYLFRYITLFAVEELVEPTLENEESIKYLDSFRDLLKDNKDAVEALVRIVKLNEKLKLGIEEDIDNIDENYTSNDNLKYYGEDTLETLKKENNAPIFSVTLEDINDCYLEGTLVILVRDLIPVIKELVDDPIKNVQDRTKVTFRLVKNFCSKIQDATNEIWVQETLKSLNDDDLKKIDEDIEKKLAKKTEDVEEEPMDCRTADEMEENVDAEETIGNTEAEEVAATDEDVVNV